MPAPGSTDLTHLLRSMRPVLHPETFVFVTVQQVDPPAESGKAITITPQLLPRTLIIQASFAEAEGLTVITTSSCAGQHTAFSIEGLGVECKLETAGASRMVSLTVHSSLEAVGLTAKISNAFAEKGLPCNVVAGYYHDHVFVPEGREEEAMGVLKELTGGEE